MSNRLWELRRKKTKSNMRTCYGAWKFGFWGMKIKGWAMKIAKPNIPWFECFFVVDWEWKTITSDKVMEWWWWHIWEIKDRLVWLWLWLWHHLIIALPWPCCCQPVKLKATRPDLPTVRQIRRKTKAYKYTIFWN